MMKDDLSIGEKLYCLEQDIEDYIQKNDLEQDKELDWILLQVQQIKEKYDKERNNAHTN